MSILNPYKKKKKDIMAAGPMRALYYPYARSFNRAMLKQAILIFDQVCFNDPVPLDIRKEYITMENGPARTELGKWDSLTDDYEFLIKQGLVKILNIRKDYKVYSQVSDRQTLEEHLIADAKDQEFMQLTSQLASRDYWEISGQRISDDDFLGAASDYFKNAGESMSGGLYTSKHRHYDNGKILGFSVHLFHDHFQGHYPVPVSCGYSLFINQALLISKLENLSLFTDDIIALRLLNRKYLRARSLVQGQEISSSILLSRAPEYFSKYQILALNVLHSLIPNEELDKRTFQELVQFKERNEESYTRFRAYLLELTSRIDSEPWTEKFAIEVLNLIDTTVVPEANKLRESMLSSYEKMFGSLVNKTVMAVTPTLAVSLFGGLSWEQILTLGTAAAAGAVSISLPGVIELWQTKRQNERSGLGFILKLK